MSGLVEDWAQQLGLLVRRRNVFVEGESDVDLMLLARNLYFSKREIDIFGTDFAVLAAGQGDDGGVEGVNRKLNAFRQLAETDLTQNGKPKFRFIGLFDNDPAGRRALAGASGFDRRIVKYRDVFLLHPVMPAANGSDGPIVERRAEELNRRFRGLNWEIEDLLSEDLLRAFQDEHPCAIINEKKVGGFVHRDFTRQGKFELRRFAKKYADICDVINIVLLIRTLHDYLNINCDHIKV